MAGPPCSPSIFVSGTGFPSEQALNRLWVTPRPTACARQQFSCSWTRGGEPSGGIDVRSEVDAVVLIYRVRRLLAAGWKPIEQRVPITWTRCHLGGRRPWFVCSVRTNGRYCGRRLAVLYAAGELFACRCCSGPFNSPHFGVRGMKVDFPIS